MEPLNFNGMTDEELQRMAAHVFGRLSSIAVEAAEAYRRDDMDELFEIFFDYWFARDTMDEIGREADMRVGKAKAEKVAKALRDAISKAVEE